MSPRSYSLYIIKYSTVLRLQACIVGSLLTTFGILMLERARGLLYASPASPGWLSVSSEVFNIKCSII